MPRMLVSGYGIILNIASTSAFQPVPYMAVYGASKAFILSFSEALWAEYRNRGIHVVALCPGPVDTGFVEQIGNESIAKTAVFSKLIPAEQVAMYAMKAMRQRGPIQHTGFKNWIMVQSSRFVPRKLVTLISANMMLPSE